METKTLLSPSQPGAEGNGPLARALHSLLWWTWQGLSFFPGVAVGLHCSLQNVLSFASVTKSLLLQTIWLDLWLQNRMLSQSPILTHTASFPSLSINSSECILKTGRSRKM